MTTPGDNGAPPEDAVQDDPFAYLYRPAEGEQPVAERPRSGYSRPMEVGRASYGERPVHPQAGPAGYGRAPGQPADRFAGSEPTSALPQQSRYAERSRPRPGEEKPAGRGKAAIIGAVAVVAAVAIGAGVALSTGDPDGKPKAGAAAQSAPAAPSGGATGGAAGSAGPSADSSPSTTALSGGTDVADAAGMKLGGGSTVAGQVAGAKAAGGKYVDGLGTVGASVSWDVNVPAAGTFQIWLRFNNSGPNATATVAVDGKPTYTPIKLNNYSPGLPPESSWYSSWVSGTVAQPGPHTISVTCQADNQCGFLLDQIAVTPNGTSKVQGW
ncbi:carbohydrate-binding protein [Kitasatospora fiedleri]|uniref:hypothetical protein n=1 Tax=Kitasatospora fiedleri TaxID=2991545 RepID=UPI000C2CC506|nr:hypothetical protein [Kitasatospora fiedleri]